MKNLCLTLLSTGLVSTGLFLAASDAFGQDADHGAADYKLCASCHGFKAEGNQLVHAPALAGQESWYLERQIRNFRNGVRGAAAADANGHTMAQMTQGLKSEQQIADIVAYIATLPPAAPQATIQGDTGTGRGLYNACSACHGQTGEGNAALNAPALTVPDDWYQLEQLKKFKDGTRGSNPNDGYGQQMIPMASTLADDKAMQDVVAYINSLR